MAKLILVCNAVFTSDSGSVQAVACRERGLTDSKTIKVAPHLFKGNIPMPGEAVYVECADNAIQEKTGSNYRTLRIAHVSLELPSDEAHAEEEAPATTKTPVVDPWA
jgi:hypothetical protein